MFNRSESDLAKFSAGSLSVVTSFKSSVLNCSRNRIVISGSELLKATIGFPRSTSFSAGWERKSSFPPGSICCPYGVFDDGGFDGGVNGVFVDDGVTLVE